MKVLTVVGTRPEIIRLAAVIDRLDNTPGIEHVLVHTGQNWDEKLNGIFFEELGLRRPKHSLGVDVSSLGATLGDILRKTEEVLLLERPDAFLVLGDTNSAFSLIMAKRMRIPTYHMEAGNRCFDENVPEETNRRLVDHTADFNLVYTEHARRNLLAEGLHPRRILHTGSPMREVLTRYLPAIETSGVLDELGLTAGGYFLVSAHREENVDSPTRLRLLVDALNAVARRWDMPVLVSTHPRTRKRLQAQGQMEVDERVKFHEPFGFLAYNSLQMNASCVLSDSGTISEEASILGFSAVTLRSSIERPEALETGAIIMSDLDADVVVAAVELAVRSNQPPSVPADYCVENTSDRVVRFIASTWHSHANWSGLR